jgi:hypothetical protein
LYSKHACHELSFFLFKKDPEFYKTVIAPHLANKKDKTFLDHFLLGSDLKAFTQPWQFGRLNVPERVLLAQKIEGEPAKTTRHLEDLLKLLPELGRTVMTLCDLNNEQLDRQPLPEDVKQSLREASPPTQTQMQLAIELAQEGQATIRQLAQRLQIVELAADT